LLGFGNVSTHDGRAAEGHRDVFARWDQFEVGAGERERRSCHALANGVDSIRLCGWNGDADQSPGTSTSIKSVRITGQFKQTNNCGTLAAGASCTINVTWCSSLVITGTLAVTDASGTVQYVSITGE
jgi:hypothetical protein